MYFLNRKRVKNFAIILAEFFPVVIGLFYLIYSSQFLQFSNTFLGKFVFLIFVIIYTTIDKIVGTFFALLYIVYYQSDLVEHFAALNNYPEYHQSIVVDPKNKMVSTSFGGTTKENFVGGLDDVSQKFVRENCKNGKLTATPGSFSMGFGPDGTCNPCDRNCWFYMLESKLNTEEKVLYPKESNTWHDRILGTLNTESKSKYEGFTSNMNIESIISPTTGVISEAFSKWSF